MVVFVRAGAQAYLGARPDGRRHDGDGVLFPLGEALRPLSLFRPFTLFRVSAAGCRELAATIWVRKGFRALRRGHAGWSASSPSSRSVW
jgi:hypothetical protein